MISLLKRLASSVANASADHVTFFINDSGVPAFKDESGTVTTILQAGAVTTSGLTMATARLLGRTTASTGAIEEISVAASLSLSAGSLAVADDGVTYAKMQNISATQRVLGRNTAGAGDTEEITLSQLLDWIGSAAHGDMLYRGASTWARLAAGTSGQLLQANGAAAPSWVAAPSPSVGKHSIWVPASAMTARASNGPLSGLVELATNKIMLSTLDFDASADEFAQFSIRMPKSWNESTMTAVFVWSHASTATNFAVVWGIQGLARSNDDALDTAFGTAVTTTDTGGTTDDLYESPESSAVTIGGTPAEGDTVIFQVYRDADNASDNLAVDARLHGVMLFYTTNAATDA